MTTLSLSIAFSVMLFFNAESLVFPNYSYVRHPMHSLSQFAGSRPAPVIMKRYYRIIKGNKVVNGGLFAPQVSSYDLYPSKQAFAIGLDALHVDGITSPPTSDEPFLHVELNNASRVFVLLNGPGINGRVLSNLTTVTGLSPAWVNPRSVQSCNGSVIPVGDPDRLGRQYSLPSLSAMLETHVDEGEILTLPHPGLVQLNGEVNASRYTLLFAEPDTSDKPPTAFRYPASPPNVTQLISGATIDVNPAMPNQRCPEWLHDLYMEKSRDSHVALREGEPLMWRTWHPVIDPIYWCYFDHEHGSFPGNWMPVFGYTAWKTYDPDTSHNRQNEPHEGFKVFSFPLHDQEKFVTITVHMKASNARRFRARFHTVSLAILNDLWEVEMELHMKSDFGSAQATLANGTSIAINEHEDGVNHELLRQRKGFLRRFNVLNVDDDYPESVDQAYLLNGRVVPTESNRDQVLRGIYEQWQGLINTCSWTEGVFNAGFNFDIRNAATAMRAVDAASGEELQWLRGDSMNRIAVVSKNTGGVEVGIEHCSFDIFGSECGVSLEGGGGVFYTDPYFAVIRNGSGTNHVRQYISPEFRTVRFKVGDITPTEPWNAHMEYEEAEDQSRRFQNVEKAVIAHKN